MARKDHPKSREKRDQIRHAAYTCFRREGYAHTSVDSICHEAGVSKGSFYWHYPSKLDVFVNIIEAWTREVMDELYEQFEDAVLEEDYASAIADALEKEIHRGRAVVPLWIEFAVLGRHEPEIRQALAKFYRRARSALAEILRPALRGRFDDAQIRGASAMAFGAYLGIMMQETSDPERVDAVDEVRAFLDAYTRDGDSES